MALRLIAPGRVPYGGGYDINRPDLGFVGYGTAFEMLERRCRDYRKANALPWGIGTSEELEQIVCEKYPDECEHCDKDLPLKRRLSMGDVVNGTKVLLELVKQRVLKGESVLLPREQAQARLDKCTRCPLNITFPIPCSGLCPELGAIVSAIVGNQHLDGEDRRSCAVCGCFTSSQVWIPYDILEKGVDDQMKVSFQKARVNFGCWKTKEGSEELKTTIPA